MTTSIDDGAKPLFMMQDIGDVELPYLLYDGHEPTLILIHATGFMPWLWHPIARDLSPSCRIMAPHICDYRNADPENGGLYWETVAQDIAAFCNRKNIENPILVGHSMGATVSTMAHVLHGVKAKGMVLIEPIFLHEDFYRVRISVGEHPLASKALKRKNHWTNPTEAMGYLRSKPLFANWTEEMRELYITHGMRERKGGGLELACSPHTEAALFLGSVHYNIWPLLPKVSCPVLVIEGEKTDSKNYIDLERAVTSIPRASHIIVADAGHLIPMEQPAKITTIIRDFIHAS